MHDTPSKLDYALWYTQELRLPVFPCWPGEKTPATSNGVKAATLNEAAIRGWWTASPDFNIGVACSEVDVLDIDCKPGLSGFPAYYKLESAGVLARSLLKVETRSRGLHLYYRSSGINRNQVNLCRQHIDVRAAGGYVLGVGSYVEHGSGPGVYSLIEYNKDAGGLLDVAAIKSFLSPAASRQDGAGAAQRRRSALARGGSSSGLVNAVKSAQEGERNSVLYWAACRALDDGRGYLLAELSDAAQATGLDADEINRTFDSARVRGQR